MVYIVRVDWLDIGISVRGSRTVAAVGGIEVRVAQISKAEVEGDCIVVEWLLVVSLVAWCCL